MTVTEAIRKLTQLQKDGYEDAELVYIDTRSGVSDLVSIGSVRVNEDDCDGYLQDVDQGTMYIPLYGG